MAQIMSDSIDQLATALAKAQAEFFIASKDSNNPFFKSKYADFESVVAASRPALTKYGLSVVQNVYRFDDGNHYLVTLLLHSSGQWVKSKAQHNPQKNDIQSLSSYNTYLKRMCYSSMVGVVTGEADDDGEAAVQHSRYEPLPDPFRVGQISTTITDYQHSQLMALVSKFDSDKEQKICAAFGIDNLTKLPVAHYAKTMSQLKDQLNPKKE